MINRNIAYNIRKMIDVMNYTNAEGIEAIIIPLDFEKAFDQVELSALGGALKYFNFGPIFIKWVLLLCRNFESCTTNYGFNSNWFQPTRGLHQGCPASAFNVLCIVEILGDQLRANSSFKDIRINDVEIKSGQFADDTNLFLIFEQESVQSAIDTLVVFECNTGLKLNYDKGNVYRIGSLKNSKAKLYTSKTLNWTNETITVLGIDIIHDMNKLTINNYELIVEKAKKHPTHLVT